MRAMVLEAYKAPLVPRIVPVPDLGPQEVLVRIRAAGVCATDLGIVSGKIPSVRAPRILGHEIAGVIELAGGEVQNLWPGDAVVVRYYITCGDCDYCRIGRDTLCTRVAGRIGLELDGGFAEFVKVPASNAFPISLKIPAPQAAVLPDAGAAAWHAVRKQGEVGAGQRVLVVGAGGLGLMAIQMARLCGAEVTAVDNHPEKLTFAQEAGAQTVILGRNDFARQLDNEDVFDVAVDLVGDPMTILDCIESLAPGGRLVLGSYGSGNAPVGLDPKSLIMKEVVVLGSRGSSKQDLVDVIRMVEAGWIRPVVGLELKLEEVNRGLELLEAREVMGRCVVIPDPIQR